MSALASPGSFKGALGAIEAAAALAAGFRRGGATAVELPVADGGDGTAAVLARALGGEWRPAAVADPLGRRIEARWLLLRDATAVVEAAEAIGHARLSPAELAPMVASSSGLGELIEAALAARPRRLLVCLGGTATVDGGAGLGLGAGFGVPVRALTDVENPLLGPRGAARAFGPQKGASPEQVEELERRLASLAELAPFAELPGAGAAGGLGAAFAALGAELVPGAEAVLETIGFRKRARAASLVVTGEGRVDATTWEGKAPGAVVRACGELGVRCVVAAGRLADAPAGVEACELSGDPARTAQDLEALGARLAGGL